MQTCPVIFVHGSLGLGGAEKLRVTMLKALQERGVQPRVCVLRSEGPLAQTVRDMGIPVDVLGIKATLTDMRGTSRLAGYFREHKPLVVQASQFLTNVHTMRAARKAGVPVAIVEEHGLYTWKRWYHRAIDQWVTAKADGILTCSASVRDFAADTTGLPREKMHVFHNCIDLEQAAAVESDGSIRRQYAPTGGLLVGVVGTLRWEKGHRDMFAAWQSLSQSGALPEGSRLLVVGDGPLAAELRQLASSIPGIEFLGSRDDVPQILASLDVFVLPSVNEGLGIAILEAMAAGLPIVSTTSGGIPEILENAETALLVSPGNPAELAAALGMLVGDANLRQQLGAAAKRAVVKHGAAAYADRLLQLHQELLRPKGLSLEIADRASADVLVPDDASYVCSFNDSTPDSARLTSSCPTR